MKVRLKLFFKWGFPSENFVPCRTREANPCGTLKNSLIKAIMAVYPPPELKQPTPLKPTDQPAAAQRRYRMKRVTQQMGNLESLYKSDLPHRGVAVYLYLNDRAGQTEKCFL